MVLVIVGSGCVGSNAVECGFGLCPPASKCDETNHMCIPPGCGDGAIAVGAEQCDGPIDPSLQLDCTSLDYYSGTLACSPECTFDTSGCNGSCGDHAINGPELCDGIPPAGETCADFGYQIGRLGCSVDCAPSFGQCATIGWQPGRGNAPDELHAVWGSSAADMFAVGRGGAILHSNGLVWSPMTSPTTQHLHGVWGTGPNNVFAVGDGGTILHYDGSTWMMMPSATTASLHAIAGTMTDAWIVGDGGTILHGSAAAGSWQPETSGVTVVLRGVAATPQGVIAVGDAATTGTASPTALLRQGATWTAMTVPSITPVLAGNTVTLSAVWGENTGFVAVGTATAVTNPPHGSVVQTNIANNTTWAFTGQSLTTQDLHAVWGVSSPQPPPATGVRTDIFVGGLGGALVHYDGVPGPAHFRLHDAGTTRGIFGLWGTGPAFVRAATLGGEVQEYDGTDLATTALALPAKNLVGVYQNPATNIAVAVGDAGTIARHDVSGWLAPTTLGSADLHAVAGAGSTVFVAGAGLAVSANDGQSFGGFTFPAVNFFGLWASSATEAWAVGEAGAIAHYTGTWTAAGTAGNKRLNGVWGASSTDIFAVGNAGTIYHYDGGTWTAQTSGVTQNLNAVWGTAGNNVFVAGGAGVILHYDGTKWRTMTSGTGQDLYAVGGTSAFDVWVGGRGTLLHFLGVSWAPVDIGLDDTLGLFVQGTDSFFAGDVAAGAGTITGATAILGRTLLADESKRCLDAWDNDGDGLVGCADPDCVNEPGCQKGGPCAPADVLRCDQPTSSATTFTGIARLDDLPCLDHATPGPEATYRFVAPASGTLTVTLDDPGGHLDLAMLAPLDPLTVTSNRRLACDPRACTAATSSQATGKALTFDAVAGETYFLVVDGPAATAEAFTLAISCP